uniref:Large ribosomal subunit protein uL22c n=1 Tax=Cyanoptyche gloeocystis TaxID=77922 RepID=A0A3G1IWG4_9EUKA|nr:ribosomal protein L22 [Cyanoptyche gloeocystis]
MKTEIKATAKYVRVSAQKIRRILDIIRGRTYREALMLLEYLPYKHCKLILKLLKSAAANAEFLQKDIDPAQLQISSVFADHAGIIKRARPRAQGRAYAIKKCYSSVTIYLKKIE